MNAFSDQSHWIHIGFPKAGSTLLQYWFDKHPQIAHRNTAFFGVRDLMDLVACINRPDNRIRCRVTSSEQLVTPVDPVQLHTAEPARLSAGREKIDEICTALARLFPDARVLIITRASPDALRSAYSEFVRQGASKSPAEFFAMGREGLLDLGLVDIDRIIALYRRAFGGRVLVLPYELLRDDSAAFFQILADEMGIDNLPTDGVRLNPSLSPSEMYWYSRFARLIARVRSQRLRMRLVRFHITSIKQGRWQPIVRLLTFLLGRREIDCSPPAALIADLVGLSDAIAEEPSHSAYREVYRMRAD